MQPYTLFKSKKSKYYSVQFRLDDKSRTSAINTGKSLKGEADEWAKQYYNESIRKHGFFKKEAKLTLLEYTGTDFFTWDGVYCKNRRATGKRINEAQALNKTAELNRQIIPYFGNYKLTDISESKIEKFRNILLLEKGYAGSTVNKVLSTLQSILKQAKKDGYIPHVPDIEKAANTVNKVKGILTTDEVRRLFADENNFPDYLTYCASLLASCTGLRLSEVQAIQLKNINPAGYIEIEKSWNNKLRCLNSTTKSGKVRRVVIPQNVQEKLQLLINDNPYKPALNGDAFLFFAPVIDAQHTLTSIVARSDFQPTRDYFQSILNCTQQTANRYLRNYQAGQYLKSSTIPESAFFPIDCNIITKGLYSALERIGIDYKSRRISYHSFRFFLNSLLIAGKVPLLQVQSMTGHLTDAMSAHYFKPQLEDMQGIREIQESIFTPSPIDTSTTDPDTSGGNR